MIALVFLVIFFITWAGSIFQDSNSESTRTGFNPNLITQRAVDIIENAKSVFNKIEGATARPELLEQFTGNFNDLATAISSSNAILKVSPNPVKVYWTGKGWHSDISKYNPPIGGVKDYNSSDIVVKNTDGVFHGFSLKKKGQKK